MGKSAIATATVSSAALLGVAFLAYHHGKRCGQIEYEASQSAAAKSESDVSNDASSRAVAITNQDANQQETATETSSTAPAKTSKKKPSDELDMLPIYPIGTLQSIYRLCVGTPRQGMLAPHSRGIITFHEHKVSKDSILELQNFSHVFVVFVFHLNSNANVRQSTFGNDSNANKKKNSKRQFPSKIAPPSLGGKKVGVFSTRTPHRPNPIGFSLCKLDKVVVNDSKSGSTSSLLLSGLDIVDGTPILDIKPYVPHYDCVGYNPINVCEERCGDALSATILSTENKANVSSNGKETEQSSSTSDEVRVPYWVDSGLQKRRNVTFLPAAEQFLQDLASQTNNSSSSSLQSLQFYGPKSPWKDTPSDALEHLRSCMHELLGVDVRSAWQTKKARNGKFQAERSSRVKDWKGDNTSINEEEKNPLCSQQIYNLLLKYTIEEPGSALMGTLDERSRGSGAEDVVVVHNISLMN